MKRLIVVFGVMLAVLVAGVASVYAQEAGTQAGSAQGQGAGTAQAASTPAKDTTDAVRLENLKLPETYAELKVLYFNALERITELEAAIQEALDLARGYRSDWAEQRAVAETRKMQTDQALELANTLTTMIREMKDIINKQHEIIMKLTATKPLSVGFSAGVSLQRTPTAAGSYAFQPGVTLGIIVFP